MQDKNDPPTDNPPATQLKPYTVLGVYRDNYQRYCTSVEARNPEEAGELAQEQCILDNGFIGKELPLIVAGVIEGRHVCADTVGEEQE